MTEKPFAKLAVYVVAGLLLVYVMIRSVAAAQAKPFWYDELMTLTVSAQGSWQAIVAVQRHPFDGNPPLFYWIENFASKLPRNQEISLRVPSILAFACALASVFFYLRKRFGEIIALLCAAFLVGTNLFQYYAVEARPYSMVVACFAFALVCYQRMPDKAWTVLLAVALTLAQCLHYYALLALAPFGLAELVYSLRARKVRWGVWGALAFGVLPLVIFWPLLSAFKQQYAARDWSRVWARVYLLAPQKIYGALLATDPRTHAGEAIAAVLFVVMLVEFVRRARQSAVEGEEKARELAQIAVLAGFLLLPMLGFVLARVTNAPLVPRYILGTLLGVAGGLALLFRLLGKKIGLALAVLVLGYVGRAEASFWKTWDAHATEVKSYGAVKEGFIEQKGYKDLAVAVPDGIAIVPLMHYADSAFAKRLVYITQDPQPSDPWFTDTVDRELERYASYSPLKVNTFDDFASGNNSFVCYFENPHDGAWLMRRLTREGWKMTALAPEATTRLYLVERQHSVNMPAPGTKHP